MTAKTDASTARIKRAVIYTRVSRDDTREGRSNQRQEDACRHLASARDYDVVEVCADISISAWSGKERPGWRRVLELIEAGAVDVVMAWHVDRMTRRMVDLEELIVLAEHHGVGVVTASGDLDLTSDSGRMVGRILAAVARAEVERKGARQKLANRQRASEGKPYGSSRRPFGYESDGITIQPSEAEALVQACKDFRSGASLRSIAHQWNNAGFVSSTAKRNPDGSPNVRGWTPEGVRRVLRNPRYAGFRTYLGEVVAEAVWEPILDLETHLAVTSKLADHNCKRERRWAGRTPQNLLTGIAVCDVCDSTLWANRLRSMLTYTCPNGHVWVDRHDSDALVRSTVVMAARRLREASHEVDDGRARDALAEASWERADRLHALELIEQRRILKQIAAVRVYQRDHRAALMATDLVSVWLTFPTGAAFLAFERNGGFRLPE